MNNPLDSWEMAAGLFSFMRRLGRLCPLCWVLFIHRHVIRVFLLFSLWPCRQNACDGVEEGFDLLLCEPFFTLFYHLQKKTSKGYR